MLYIFQFILVCYCACLVMSFRSSRAWLINAREKLVSCASFGEHKLLTVIKTIVTGIIFLQDTANKLL